MRKVSEREGKCKKMYLVCFRGTMEKSKNQKWWITNYYDKEGKGDKELLGGRNNVGCRMRDKRAAGTKTVAVSNEDVDFVCERDKSSILGDIACGRSRTPQQ